MSYFFYVAVVEAKDKKFRLPVRGSREAAERDAKVFCHGHPYRVVGLTAERAIPLYVAERQALIHRAAVSLQR